MVGKAWHENRNRKLDDHILSACRKQKESKKWGESVSTHTHTSCQHLPKSVTYFSNKATSPKDGITFPNDITNWEQVFKYMSPWEHLNHHRHRKEMNS